MDIASRLKEFMQLINIPVTQMADTCGVPRPSMSQLLNGRNKKVSNELIGKIHDAYPQLSVLWLMFGQGDMLVGNSEPLSKAQDKPQIDFNDTQSSDTDHNSTTIDFDNPCRDFSSEKRQASQALSQESEIIENDQNPTKTDAVAETRPDVRTEGEASQGKSTFPSSVTLPTDRAKQIVNIIVYYSDNSFESFVPNS